MAKGHCERFHPHLSAYADGTMSPKRWEQVTYHLAGCQECRDELADIASVCSKLSGCEPTDTPDALAARLESIAGEHAATPLYMAAGSGELPSQRRRRVRRAAQGGVALLAVMVSAVVLAALVAPSPMKIADPVKAARELYSQSLTAISVNEAVGAMLLANERGADFGASETYEPRLSETESLSISRDEAAGLLRRAAEADLSLTGTQQVWASDGTGLYRTAVVRTNKVTGYGASLEVFDARGALFGTSFLPEFRTRTLVAPEGWEYVRSATVEQIVGRDAIRVQANSGDTPVAKWWLDAESGLLLWGERYDALGRVNIAFGYKSLILDTAAVDESGGAQLISLQPASSSQADGWCVGFAQCPQWLAGLPLVAYATSEQRGAPSMNLVYSDGFHTAVVEWTEGVLGDGVLSRTDRAAEMAVEVWQSGDAVISVACDCTPALMLDIKNELPAQAAYTPSLAGIIRDGLARLTKIG